MTATSDLRTKTRRAWMLEDAAKAGLYIRTYSPGDGVTRYRFFTECDDCHGINEANEREAGDCLTCGNATPSGYFGPNNGIYTALGLKEAETFVVGYSKRS